MKPRLVHNWPDVKNENDELSSRILTLADDYTKELKENKKHGHESEDKYNFRSMPTRSKDNETELKPVLTEEENFGKFNFS
jgi:hypothetical protein